MYYIKNFNDRNDPAFDIVARATVKILSTGGQGVLVDGGCILTAAHCIPHDAAQGDVFHQMFAHEEEVETADGTILEATPKVIESVHDVALLDAIDSDWATHTEAMKRFMLRTQPVPLFLGSLTSETFPVWFRNRKGEWITGEVGPQKERSDPWMFIDSDDGNGIECSGGPVVTEDGKLVAVMPQSPAVDQSWYYPIARPHLALPQWALNLISQQRFDDIFRESKNAHPRQ